MLSEEERQRSLTNKPNQLPLTKKYNKLMSQTTLEQQREDKVNKTWNTQDKTNIKETEVDDSNAHNYITSNSFNRLENIEKWSRKISRSTRLPYYLHEGKITQKNRRTSNEINFNPWKSTLENPKGKKSNSDHQRIGENNSSQNQTLLLTINKTINP